MAVSQEQGPPKILWEGESRWIAISAALLGEVGQMQVLTPSILIHPITPQGPTSDPTTDLTTDPTTDPSEDPSEEFSEDPSSIPREALELAEVAEPILLTPPPTEFLPADITAAAKQWMTMAADRLAIAGAAHIDAFVHADKGEIIIIDVHTVPDLSQESLLLRQVCSRMLLNYICPLLC